ncbi:MAG: hypothetical protein ACNS62_24240 [Candidatus Cyclobacteriaceae bacterium M3_2C_046]
MIFNSFFLVKKHLPGKSGMFLLVLLLFTSNEFVNAQPELVLENNPIRIDWKQVNTPHFRILFQEGNMAEALRTANVLETLYYPVSASLDQEPQKISVLLQNRSSESNAFVTVGPRRSEFYTMPPQDYNFLGNNEWIDLLAVHEFRHVVQYEKSKTGFNKLFYYLFGEDAYGGFAQLAMPSWFWEGDAVGIETALTPGGRGRIPNFDLVFRTNLLTRGPFDYSKQHLRSFKHYVPDHYVTGYFMTTHVRRNFGRDIWSDISERAWKAPFLPWRLSRALRLETGKNLTQTYWSMIDELDSLWHWQLEGLEIIDTEPIKVEKSNTFTNYRYPQAIAQNQVIALKNGIGDIDEFVLLDQHGNEEKVFTPGIMNNTGMLSVQAGKIAWNEYTFHPRWRAENYSVIKVHDIQTGKTNQITHRSRYASAALSHDGSKIVTVLTTGEGKFQLVVLNTENGQVVKTFDNPDNDFYLTPRFSQDGRQIVTIRQRDGAKTIALVDYATGEFRDLWPPNNENIGYPVLYDHYVFYNSPYSGIDNVYAYDLNTNQKFQVTSRKYGAYNASVSPDGAYIFFNDFSQDGMDVVRLAFNPSQWQPLPKVEVRKVAYYEPLIEQEGNPDILDQVTEKDYPVSDYKLISGIINPYAWGPYISTSINEVFLGISSQDVLSTTAISAGYEYDANENTGKWLGRVSFQALYPIIDVTVDSQDRNVNDIIEGREVNFQWNEKTLNVGLRLPFNFTNSKYWERLNVSTNGIFTRAEDVQFETGGQTGEIIDSDGYLNALRYRIQYQRQLKQSQRDIRSRWGQGLYAQYTHTPLGGEFTGMQFSAQGLLLFPGLFRHHSLLLRANTQLMKDYTFNNAITFPRGYPFLAFEEYYGGSVEYALPLWYPDINFSSLINFQRIKSNFFYDRGWGQSGDFSQDLNSLGLELTADVNFLRILLLWEIGVRYSFNPATNTGVASFMLGSFGF